MLSVQFNCVIAFCWLRDPDYGYNLNVGATLDTKILIECI